MALRDDVAVVPDALDVGSGDGLRARAEVAAKEWPTVVLAGDAAEAEQGVRLPG